MRSLAEEFAALHEMMYRHSRGKLAIYRPGVTLPGPVMRAYGHYPVDDGGAKIAVCMLNRGEPLRLPDNALDGCADCFAAIEYDTRTMRPGLTRICAFCALKRLSQEENHD